MRALGVVALAVAVLFLTATVAGAGLAALRVTVTVHVGKHPAGMAIAAGSLWVTNDVDNTVTRVDPAAGTVTGTIALRGKGYPDPTFTAVGGDALWLLARNGTVSKIDLQSGELVATLSVPGDALGIALVGDSVWVTSFDEYRCNKTCFSRLSRIDTRSNRATGTFTVPTPTGMAFGVGSLWIVNHRAATVTRFDPRRARVIATIRVRIGHESPFEGPERIATGLGAVWVSHPAQDVVTRIDPRTNKVVARIRFPKGSAPVFLAIGAESVWTVGAKQIFRIDARRNRVIDSASIGNHPGSDYRGLRQILVSGNTLWVTDGDADTVDRIDLR